MLHLAFDEFAFGGKAEPVGLGDGAVEDEGKAGDNQQRKFRLRKLVGNPLIAAAPIVRK
ncbi:hypothetical protein [Pararhizobium sp. A13]|uniref:hypothetical protein n=1 Tax=Pararhizobium sp. A13 TaxID=3133975 RepID=UPI003256698F